MLKEFFEVNTMSRSKIIKDLATGKVDMFTAMKILKILLLDFPKPEIEKWVNCELNGYLKTDHLPNYRKFNGDIKADFFVGYTHFTGTRIPINQFPVDIRKSLVECTIYDSLSSILSIKDMKEHHFAKIIQPEFYKALSKGTTIDSITSAMVYAPNTAPTEILATVENRLLDIFCLLEKEFGNLDELDIDLASKSSEQIEDIGIKIVNIISVDNSVSVGNDNNISDSHFSA